MPQSLPPHDLTTYCLGKWCGIAQVFGMLHAEERTKEALASWLQNGLTLAHAVILGVRAWLEHPFLLVFTALCKFGLLKKKKSLKEKSLAITLPYFFSLC